MKQTPGVHCLLKCSARFHWPISCSVAPNQTVWIICADLSGALEWSHMEEDLLPKRVSFCSVGDTAELHDYSRGSGGSAAGYCSSQGEARAGGGEECTHLAEC